MNHELEHNQEYCQGQNPIYLVPWEHLYATQLPEEYSYKKKRAAQFGYEYYGPIYLLRHPLSCVCIHEGNNLAIYVYDGHHRLRYCFPWIINKICPITLTDISHFASQRRKPEEAVIEELQRWSMSTIHSFNRIMAPKTYNPKPIPTTDPIHRIQIANRGNLETWLIENRAEHQVPLLDIMP